MIRLLQLLPTGAELEDVQQVLADNPDLAETFAGLTDSQRTRTRASAERAYGKAGAEFLVPLRVRGPPRREDTGPWAILPRTTLKAIADELKVELPLSVVPEEWTEDMAHRAADAVVRYYPNNASALAILSKMRKAMMLIGVPPVIFNAAHRPEMTVKMVSQQAKRRDERIREGIDVPAPFARIADLKERVERFVATGPHTPPTPQDAADFLVTFSARPGEAATLDLSLGPLGGVVGALKKRGKEDAYPIVSALPTGTAEAMLRVWKSKPPAAKKAAMEGLQRLVKTWGIQVRDLRAIGASLAIRMSLLEGETKNTGQAHGVLRAALRHGDGEPETRGPASLNYERVHDPVAQIAAQLAEMTVEDLEDIKKCIGARREARAT